MNGRWLVAAVILVAATLAASKAADRVMQPFARTRVVRAIGG